MESFTKVGKLLTYIDENMANSLIKDEKKDDVDSKTKPDLYDKKYSKKVLDHLKDVSISTQKTHLIIKNLFTSDQCDEFVSIAKPLFPKARQGLITDQECDDDHNDSDLDKYNKYKVQNPVRWVNIRGRNDIILNQTLDCFLSVRQWYNTCLRNGIQILDCQTSDDKNDNRNDNLKSKFIASRKNGTFRNPYVFSNLYNGGSDCNDKHGLGYHKDDVDWFSVVILLTEKDDPEIGSIIIKNEQTNNLDKVCLCKGDAVVLAKGVVHCVPTVKRKYDRMSLNVFF